MVAVAAAVEAEVAVEVAAAVEAEVAVAEVEEAVAVEAVVAAVVAEAAVAVAAEVAVEAAVAVVEAAVAAEVAVVGWWRRRWRRWWRWWRAADREVPCIVPGCASHWYVTGSPPVVKLTVQVS